MKLKPLKQPPLTYCIWLLSKREYSEQQLRQKLTQKQVSSSDIDATLTRLKDLGYQSDERAARMVALSSGRAKGDRVVIGKLRQKGLDDFEAQALEALDPEQDRLVLACERFTHKDLSDKAVYEKAVRFLLSRGFSYDGIKKGLKDLKTKQEDPD